MLGGLWVRDPVQLVVELEGRNVGVRAVGLYEWLDEVIQQGILSVAVREEVRDGEVGAVERKA
jgi:hypothetical protein